MYFNRKNAEQKNWRMIKKGKHFLFGCSLVFAIGAALVAPSVKADTVEANPEAGSTTEGIKPVVAEEDVTYAAPAVEVAPSTLAAPDTVVTEEKAEKPVATTENSKEEAVATTTVSVDKSQLEAVLAQAKAKSLEGQEASVKAEVAVAIAEAEALVANGSASQEKVNQSVERLTQAVASVKEVTEAVAETTKAAAEATTESSATPKVRNRRAVEGSVRSVDETNLQRAVVTKENFESFFQEGGTATYDKSTGTIKLTDDVSGQVGSAYLRFKINSGQPFTFTGKVDIGNKYEGKTDADGRPGGDGVGFVFHTGKVDTIGQSGASIGMGTIKNAFGFKLDSWHNTSNPNAAQNASADPKYSYRRINGKFEYEQNAFGAFYSSNAAGKVTTVGDAKALNPNPNGQWVDFKIEYDSKKNFTVTYGSQTWTTNLSKANTSIMTTDAKNALTRNNPTFALSFLGSTGSGTNLQRVQIERFEFTAPQIVHMKFVDVSGNEIEASSAIPGDENEVVNLSTQNKKIAAVEAKGYKLKRIDHSQARYYNEDNNTVTLKPGGQLLTYIFEEKDTKAPDAPKVNSVTAGATAVTGTAEAGSTVEVTLPDGTKKSATADKDGNYSVPVSALKEGDKVSVTATDDAGNKSTPTTVTVPDTTAPTTPKVNPVTAGATAVTGTAEAGSTVEVTLPNGSKASAKAGQDGNFSVPVSALKEGDTVSVTATDAAGNKSTPASVTVPDTTAPATPKVNPVTAGATAVTGTAEAGSTVEVTLPDGTKKSATADKDGNYSVPVSALKEGDTVSVTATDDAGNKSTPASVTVPDTTAPATPKVNPVKAGATAITGTAESGSTVEVTLPNGQKASAKAGDNGEFSITVPSLNADDQISVTATDAANNTSTPIKVTVKETVRPVLNIPYDDAANQDIYVYSGETNNIELKVTDNSGKIVKAYLAMTAENRTGLGKEDNTYLNGKNRLGMYLNAEKIKTETTATEASPAVIRVTGDIPKNTYKVGDSITRYLFAEDAAGNTSYEHVGAKNDVGAPGRIRFVWKPQTFKYNAQAPTTPLTSNTVPEASAIEKAVKDANPTFSDKIGSVTLDGTNVKVIYKDGSTDVISANSVFTIEPTAPKVTPVKNPSSLTQPEKDAVKKAVETANKTATKVEVGTDGTTTLTYSNGSTATLKPAQTVKAADANGLKAPATKTPVKDTANLTDGEKAEVKKAVEAANPGSVAEVGQDGTTKVTFPDKSEGTLTPAQTVVKAKDAAGIKEPATKTPVKDTANLTDDEKAEVKKAVEAANPGSVAEVGQDGTTKVTFPDKSEGTLTPAQTVVKAKDAAGIKEPATKTPVKDTANLTDDEKAEVKKAVEAANPGSVAEVGQDGTTKVTFPDKSEGTLTPAQTVVKAKDAAGIKEPATKTPVKDTANLTDGEKAEVKKAVEAANPGSVAEVGQDGTTKVTFPDKSEGTLTPAQTVVKAKDAAGIKEPATKTPVKDTANLTDGEKAEVKKAVEAANPGSVAEVGQDGTTKVTFPDKSEGTLTSAQTVVKAKDAAGIKEPATKTPVKDTANLTDGEKAEVKKAVEAANPGSVAEVGQDGTTKVTFPDKSEGTLTPAQTVVKAKDAAGIKEPATKTPVKDTANLTDGEKAEVKKAVEAANPGSVAEVGQDGTTKVTFPDKSEGTLTPAQTVVKAEEKAKDADGLKAPETKTPVKDTANLTDAEKAEVKKAVEAANPGSVAEVGQDGTTKVTFPDKSEGTLTPAQTVVKAEEKAKDADGLKAPETKTPVKDTANLTDAEKAEVKKAVEAANPGSVAEVGQDGTTKVTFPDKSEGTLTPAQTVVKAKDAAGIKEPATKTPVKDTANLTDGEKAEVKKAVEAANPGSVAEVGQDGTTKVTFPDKSEGTLTGDQTVKAADANGAKAPEAKTPVKDTSALTDEEKTQVAEEILKANPTLADVDVANDGTATVTFTDGSKATLTPAQTVVKAEEKAKDADGLKAPATKTPVKDTANLTDGEKAEVKKAVEAANPGSVAEVGQDGTTKVTFPDKSEGTLTPAQTVVKAEEKAKDADGLKAPETKTPVKDTANLTEDEKAEVKKAVEAANPGSVAEVGQDGTTKVTFPDKSEGTLTSAQTVVKAKDAAGIKEPATKTPVKDTANLTDGEKAEVKKAVEAANPGSVAEVGQDGTTKVTFPDKSEGTLTPAQTVVKAKDAAGIKEPATKTPVKDTANLTDGEKAEVKKAVEAANPGSVAEVGQDGTTKVTFPDKSEGTLTPAQTVVKAEEKAKDADGLKAPETKTPVKDTANLTDAEKAEVKKAVEAANPGSVAEVGQDGTTKVTFPDKSEGTLTPAQTVVKAEEKAKDADGLKAPETKTPVKDTANLTDAEKAEVKKAVEAANPGSVAEVGQDGTTKVTFPDKSEGTLTGDQTVKAADANGAKAPEAKTPVKDTANLTEEEKTQVAEEILKANPTLADVDVANDGTATVTFPDGSKATLTPAQTVVKAEEKAKDADGLKAPETKTPVKDTANLTDAEKAEVKKAVEAANPGSVAEVGQDGTTTVTFPDKSEGTLTPEQTVVKAEEKAKDADGLKAPETKTPVKDTANLTDAEKAEVKKAVEAANPGSVAEVGQDGTTTVTFPDGSTATLTGDKTVKEADSKGVQEPAAKTPVQNTSALTQPEKDAVKKAVEDANPTATKVEVGNDGSATVTFPDGSTATLTPAQTVVKAEDKEAPTAPVVNPVKAGDTAVTGTAEAGSTVEVTLPNGTKATATADKDGNFSVPVSGLEEGQTVSVTAKDASNNTSTPTTATVAKADDKTAPDAPVVNPVKAGDTAVTGTAEAGSTVEVTLPDGTKATATADKDGNFSVPVSGLEEGQTVSVTAKDASNNTSTPTTATVAKADDKTAPDAPVVNPVKAGDTAVTGTAEAGSTVEVTLPDGTKATATADKDGNFSVPVSGLEEGQTVSVTAKDASNNTSTPTTATVAKADDKTAPDAPVVNPVKAGDTAVTGTAEAGSTVEVTLPDGTKATATADKDGNFSVPVMGLKAGDKVTAVAKDASGNTSTPTEKTVGKRDVKDADGIQAPSTKTPVKDTANLTDAEKAKVKEAVEAANPGSKAEVGQDGTTTVTFPDGSTATLTGDQTVKAADANGVKAPTTKTPVKDTANLTDAEKAKVKEAVEAANPGSKAEVGQDGTTTVTFPDGSTATLTGDQTVKAADANGVKAPTTKTPVKDTANLTDDEKAAVKKAVEAANPGSKAEVGQDGTTTVTFQDGSTATLTGDQTVKAADANGVKAPTTKTPVKDTANLTDDEKAAVKKAVEAANPGSKAEVGQDGTTTVTFPDGSTATLTGDKTVTQADITAPTAPVVNPVKAGDKAITGTAEAGSTVEVTLPDGTKVSAKADKDGKFSIPVNGLNAGDTVSVTATDESGNTSATTTVTVSNVNVGGKEADNAKVPALTPVVDPNNLTDAEKAKVAEEVKKANPTATDVKVNNDGSVVVTFADGSVATIAANKVVKEATKESSAQAPAKKAGAKELPNTGTKQSNASLGLALLAAVTGGLLVSKKRKEEE